ncbi:MAG: S-layer homology domain-containing protein [Clostridia bacterium]|nr:S-layer homology domain-containing protein [Clostridia bacterium]
MHMRLLKRCIIILLVLLLSSSAAFAAPNDAPAASAGDDAVTTVPADMPSGWSHDAVASAVENGLLNGDSEGLLHPGDTIKGSELAAIMVRAFGAGEKAGLSGYTDVPPDAWYYDEMSYAVGAGWIKGDGDGHLMPEAPVSRARFFTVTARTLGLSEGDPEILKDYPDGADVPVWAQGTVASMLEAGFIRGTDRGIEPDELITREAVCQVFYNIFDTYISEPGVYTGLTGSVLVSCNGVTIEKSSLERLCVGSGVTDTVGLRDSSCKAVLGNADAVKIADTVKNEVKQSSSGGSGGGRTKQYTLADAIAHFNAHSDNYTISVNIISTYSNSGPSNITIHTLREKGSMEQMELSEPEKGISMYIFDWEKGREMFDQPSGLWVEQDISYMGQDYSMNHLSLTGVEAGWFTETEPGVFELQAEHLPDLAKMLYEYDYDRANLKTVRLTAANGVITGMYLYSENNYGVKKTVDCRFSDYGHTEFSVPTETFTLLDSTTFYNQGEPYTDGAQYYMQGLGMLWLENNEGFAVSVYSYSGVCFAAIPVRCDASVAALLESGNVFDAVVTVRLTGDELLPYALELDAQKIWKQEASCRGFNQMDTFVPVYFSNYPYPLDLRQVTLKEEDGSFWVYDAEGYEFRFLMEYASDELRESLDSVEGTFNLQHVLAVLTDNDDVMLLPIAPTRVGYYPAANPGALSVPVGTAIDDLAGMVELIDEGTGKVIYQADDPGISFVSETYDAERDGIYEVTVCCGGYEIPVNVHVYESRRLTPEESADLPRLSDLGEGYLAPELPSRDAEGKNRTDVLVIPVIFPDNGYESAHMDDPDTPEDELAAFLEMCFNDTTGATGWYSLTEYYEAESGGRLHLHADILEPYVYSYANDSINTTDKMDAIMIDAINAYAGQGDFSKYDNDGDGDIDCVYFVYLGDQYSFGWGSWSNSLRVQVGDDDMTMSSVVWMSLDFFDMYMQIGDLTLNADCSTLIHETGHTLGLADYYDRCTTGSTDLMDTIGGSLTPFSRMLLGWSDPEVLYYAPATRTLRPMETSDDVIMVSRDPEATVFGEYYTISFHAPIGTDFVMNCMGDPIFTDYGVTVYHVNSELKPADPSIPRDSLGFYFNAENFLRLLRRGPVPEFKKPGSFATDDDLFRAGDSVTLYWDDGAPAMVLTVNSISADGASVSLSLPN